MRDVIVYETVNSIILLSKKTRKKQPASKSVPDKTVSLRENCLGNKIILMPLLNLIDTIDGTHLREFKFSYGVGKFIHMD